MKGQDVQERPVPAKRPVTLEFRYDVDETGESAERAHHDSECPFGFGMLFGFAGVVDVLSV